VKSNGKKAWRYRFKLNGKSSMFALGEYPTVKLAEAREKCEQARKQVANGVSPTQARQLDKIRKVNDASNIFELVAKEWLQMKDWAEITKTRRLDMLKCVVFPAIGELPVREITPHHILKILKETAKRGAPSVAAEARRTISSIFELAVATLRADSDPAWPVRKALPANKTQHKQALSPQQIGKLLSCFDNGAANIRLTISRPAWRVSHRCVSAGLSDRRGPSGSGARTPVRGAFRQEG